MIAAVLCTGPSMTPAVAQAARRCYTVAVNASFRLAPWADALAANDLMWWQVNRDADGFNARRFCHRRAHRVEAVSTVKERTCSGVLALEVARLQGATTIELHGADMRGGHFFGDYSGMLKNTSEEIRVVHAMQFAEWGAANSGILVLNRTPDSALECFPRG